MRIWNLKMNLSEKAMNIYLRIKWRTRLSKCCLNMWRETVFMNTENNKMNETHNFVLNLSQRLDLKSSNKHVALQNLSIYDTWKHLRKQYKNNKLNTEFELTNDCYSVSDIQGYIKYIIKPLNFSVSLIKKPVIWFANQMQFRK